MPKSKDTGVELNESTPILQSTIQGAHHTGGLTVFTTIFFLIGEIIGVGALALPNSLARSGFAGIFTICCACAIAIYNGSQLGYCWTILLERYPEYRVHCRYPYSAIGERACGKWMRYVVAFAIVFTCLGTCVLYLLLAAENVHSLMTQAGLKANFCLVMVLFACVLAPLSWFGSPKDFTWIAVIAFLSATIGLILIFANLMVELPPPDTIQYDYPSEVRLYFLSFGAILAAFAGASTFPTIQHDMKEPKKFTLALVISYLYSFAVYTTIAVSGYYIYGETVIPNILVKLPNGPIKITALVMYVIHLTFAYILFLNPPVQHMEESLKIPNRKCHFKRMIFRTALVAGILFVAESIPHFGALLDLLGGSSAAFLTFIAPPIFYLRLCKNGYRDERGHIRYIPLWMKIINILVICVGIIVACVSTYAAIDQLSSPKTFVPPCYVNATAAELSINH